MSAREMYPVYYIILYYIILYYIYILYHQPMRFAANKFTVTLLFVDDDRTWDTGAWITHLP